MSRRISRATCPLQLVRGEAARGNDATEPSRKYASLSVEDSVSPNHCVIIGRADAGNGDVVLRLEIPRTLATSELGAVLNQLVEGRPFEGTLAPALPAARPRLEVVR